jgi:hypothetical protein
VEANDDMVQTRSFKKTALRFSPSLFSSLCHAKIADISPNREPFLCRDGPHGRLKDGSRFHAGRLRVRSPVTIKYLLASVAVVIEKSNREATTF